MTELEKSIDYWVYGAYFENSIEEPNSFVAGRLYYAAYAKRLEVIMDEAEALATEYPNAIVFLVHAPSAGNPGAVLY